MLRISKLADYGTVVMVYLAHESGVVHNAKEIATHVSLAVPTVSKLLKLLAAQNLLLSQRGVKGGYMLSRDPSEISVAEIIEAVEGNSGLTECSHKESECFLEDVCAIRGNWRLISNAIYKALASISLVDLAKPVMRETAVDVSQIEKFADDESRGGSLE